MPKQNRPPFRPQKLEEEEGKQLPSHRAYLSDPVRIDPKNIAVGDVIRFTYNAEERTVFVLNPEWQTMLHGLSMKAIDRRTLMLEVVAKADLYRSPIDFYARVVKGKAIQETDSYRTYDIRKMGNVRKLTYQIDERGREKAGTGDLHDITTEAFELPGLPESEGL